MRIYYLYLNKISFIIRRNISSSFLFYYSHIKKKKEKKINLPVEKNNNNKTKNVQGKRQ
jgi:hypothetical protein